MIRDDRDELITALIRKLGGEARISSREMLEANDCTIEMSLDLDGVAIYRVHHPRDRHNHSQMDPSLLIAALMDYAREADVTFSREYLEVHMRQYNVEITDNRQAQTTRVRVWDKHGLPPSDVNPAPPPTPPVQAEATRLPLLEITDG